ncbi:pullulanase-type alpha-1,6-glucosidase [Acidipila sp. EB88]|uniref:pullulanase-type alpha-1,6-glucosidase n=1 Tax=Acidipila sp. EB88 TaxID=2305226 RepID=UPI000F5E7AF5|nr:pullulanase-type alpha-1,6-glucosidase [Acidipila sp. EB88]
MKLFRPLLTLCFATALFALAATHSATAQTEPPIPAGEIRVHYFRPDGVYTGWTVYAFGDTTEPNNFAGGPVPVTGTDSFGAYFDVGVTTGAADVGLILHIGNTKDPGPDEHVDPATQGNEFWELSGSDIMLNHRPTIGQDGPIPANHARIHYYRPDGNYANWSLYPFGTTTDPSGTFCSTEDYYAGYDSYGPYFDVGVSTGQLGFIIHNCTTGVKDPGPNQYLQIPQEPEGWVISGDVDVFPQQPAPAQLLLGPFNQLQSYWIDATTIAVQPQYAQSGYTWTLNASPTAGLQITATGLTGGTRIALTPFSGTLTQQELTRFPQLAGYALFKLPVQIDPATVRQALKSQLEVAATAADGTLKYTTGVQTFGALDALLAYAGPLGVVIPHGITPDSILQGAESPTYPIQIKVWAPTAQSLSLLLFREPTDTVPAKTIAMQEQNGVWSAGVPIEWRSRYYQLQARVYVAAQQAILTNTTTDPYSVDLSLNGTMSRITDLASETTKPALWDFSPSPRLDNILDTSIYELHVRDFSVADSTVPASHRGTYDAFADQGSDGMRHLHALALSGLKAVHILPSFHFASVNEDKSTWTTTGNLAQYPPDSEQQQQAVTAVQSTDAYNWGYDPVHYMTPEGAYAINPDNRVLEYRAMVQGLHLAGLRVIQDVVFNHTSASGQDPSANLDELVPNYYHRLDANGVLETGSCCADIASEHQMTEKLMIDTLLLNAKQYKIDGFRFDEMGMHFVYNMVDIRNALDALTVERDGIDGSKIYVYGEGFQIAEAANNAIGPNASQINLYGTGIGSFNDRMRDSVRGGNAFGTAEQVQGFATGLLTDSSSYTNQNTAASDQRTTLLQGADLIRLSLAGALRDYTFQNYLGQTTTGAQLNYGGQPAGYTATPLEDVNYCSVHDNQDLFDAVQLKSAEGDTIGQRARRQVLAMSLIALGEGIPFFHGGDDLLRSKDMDNNSYDSGDWFNKIDWSGKGNNWGTGLPIASQNQSEWPVMQPLLANPALEATPTSLAATTQAFQEFLRIRYSSGLFRMATFNEVQQNLSFLNTGQSQTPGLIVMKLDDHGHAYGDAHHIVVFFNAANTSLTYTDSSLQGMALHLHPVQQASSDATVQQSTFNSKEGSATIPALTTVVFVSEKE